MALLRARQKYDVNMVFDPGTGVTWIDGKDNKKALRFLRRRDFWWQVKDFKIIEFLIGLGTLVLLLRDFF